MKSPRHGFDATDEGPGSNIMPLVRETADRLGDLIHGHMKLVRLELVSDGKEFGKQLLRAGSFALLAVLGYAFLMISLGAALAPRMGAAVAFLIIGGAHTVAGAVGLIYFLRHQQTPQLMDRTLHEVRQSVAEITAQAGAAAPRETGSGH